ncbi:hypothetical protein ET445_01920 [Agromyces protaetiae]|uniref:Uncharacterized protein n=1 Tax=Agromyces protaetiae TaxID=2509455 RepID=A0A4P6FP65_9MICO|nr:hypothetical protein [Agromyces protaetiae]QAY72278.1 hypothetical protein ET445_01920 [Agromyces protaetiae]
MNSVLTVGHPTSISHELPPFARVVRRVGFALLAWSRRMQHVAPTHAELAELHDHRLEAERLRADQYAAIVLGRLM